MRMARGLIIERVFSCYLLMRSFMLSIQNGHRGSNGGGKEKRQE